MSRARNVLVVALALALAACSPAKKPPPAPTPDVGLGQGWTQAQRDAWYEGSQGSRLIPWAWAQALESAGGVPFFDPRNMATFGYLTPEATSSTGLPVGFALDDQDDSALSRTKVRWYEGKGVQERWLGMTCAACHTAEIAYQGKTLRIDGGPALADYQSFIEAFDTALGATRTDAARWERFAAKVLIGRDTPANRTQLSTAFDKLVAFQGKIAKNDKTALRYGPARLDAVGLILNRVGYLAAGDAATPNEPNAPVSYPFIWNTSQSDKVQWNGMVKNNPLPGPGGSFDYGALGRNIGEVTGVFADVALHANAGASGYPSSAQVINLDRLERQLATLLPPAWPVAMFGPIDETLRAEGQTLFAGQCARCHQPLARTDLSTRFKANMLLFRGAEAPGTDIWMACNAWANEARTGVLRGTPREYMSGDPLGDSAPAAQLLAVSVKGALVAKQGDLAAAALESWLGVDRPPRVTIASAGQERGRPARRRACETATHETLGYKARPLTGIWATAPYLHNGSAPTLYDVLLPATQRPRTFFVGTREYDPVRVGYRTDAAPGNRFTFNAFAGDAPMDGNSNAGHDYGNAALSDAQRRALVEYMKSL